MPMADAVGSGRLVAPQDVHARIVFLCTCMGVLIPAEGSDPAWGYVDGLLGNGHVAAVITSWSVLLPGVHTHALVLSHLYRGATTGEAVAALNRHDEAARLAVLGDPDVRIPPLPAAAIEQFRFGTPDETLPGDGGRFLAALTYAAAVETEGEQQALAAAANDTLRMFEHAAGLGLVTSDESEIGTSMREAVAAFLGCCGSQIFQHWVPLTSSRRRLRERCHECGGQAYLFEYGFRQSGLPARALLICRSCGVLRDAPAGSQLGVTRDGRTFFLHGPLPSKDWVALLHLGCQDRTLSTRVPWPADESGAPARIFTPPGPWPPGQLAAGVILLAGAELTIVTTWALGDRPDSAGA
jgi:hypothetical protein